MEFIRPYWANKDVVAHCASSLLDECPSLVGLGMPWIARGVSGQYKIFSIVIGEEPCSSVVIEIVTIGVRVHHQDNVSGFRTVENQDAGGTRKSVKNTKQNHDTDCQSPSHNPKSNDFRSAPARL